MASAPTPRASSRASLPKYAPYALVGVAVLGYYVWKKRSATSSTGTAAGNAVVMTPSTDASSVYDPSQAIGAMAGAASTDASGSGYQPPQGESFTGAGYTSPAGSQLVTGEDGSSYQSITNAISAAELKKAGTPLWYQPLPGVFQKVTGPLKKGTAEFYQRKG